MITTYSISQFAEAIATPEPKHVWIDGGAIHVYTGADIPPPPPPAIEYVEKSVAIAALKAAGVAGDAAAETALVNAKNA